MELQTASDGGSPTGAGPLQAAMAKQAVITMKRYIMHFIAVFIISHPLMIKYAKQVAFSLHDPFLFTILCHFNALPEIFCLCPLILKTGAAGKLHQEIPPFYTPHQARQIQPPLSRRLNSHKKGCRARTMLQRWQGVFRKK
jgi:hypothetical protein